MVITATTYTELYFPRSGDYASAITFHSEVTNADYTYQYAEFGDCSDYHHFLVDLEGLPEGEYVYTVGTDSGVVRVGDYKVGTTQYKHKETHKEYNIYG